MSVQVLVSWFQEVRSNNRKCICPCCLYLLGETYSCSGRAASGSHIYRYSLVNDLNHTFGHLNLLVLIDHMELTVTSKDEDTVYTMLDQVVDQLFSCLIVNALLCVTVERCDDRSDNAFHFHHNYFSPSLMLFPKDPPGCHFTYCFGSRCFSF